MSSQIDFSKYRRPELAEHLGAILSFPGTFKTILHGTCLAVITVWVIVPPLFFDRVHWVLFATVFVYATLCAIA